MSTVTMTGSTTQSRTANAANEIATSSGIVTPLYDAAGNMIYGAGAWRAGKRRRSITSTTPGTGWWRSTPTTARAAWASDRRIPVRRAERRVTKSLFDPFGNPTGGHQYYYSQNGQVLEDRSVDTNGVAQSIDQFIWAGQRRCAAGLPARGNADGDPTNDNYYTDWRRYYLTDANGDVTTMIRFGADPVFGSDEIAYVTRVIYTAYGMATKMDENWTNGGVEERFRRTALLRLLARHRHRSVPDPEPLLQPEPLDVDQQGSNRV